MEDQPVFSALSTSARQLYLLLRCISFGPQAEVQITPHGIRFSVDESRVVQGHAFVEKTLFSSYTFNSDSEKASVPTFRISMSALLETLQIFGLSDSASSYRNQNGGFSSSYSNAFNTPALALALGGTCRISYAQIGSPLSITIQEGSVTTSCDINTYEIQTNDEDEGIPLDRDSLCLKVIMRSTWLNDAIAELSGTNPTILVINASARSPPYFTLEAHGGPFGDSTVDYQPESQSHLAQSMARSKTQPAVTETFAVSAASDTHGRVKQRYKFDLIKKAGRAMALASKVSIRQDRQGVLSLQFMIELVDGGFGSKDNDAAAGVASASGRVSFVDFRFVPLVEDEDHSESEYGDTVNNQGSETSG